MRVPIAKAQAHAARPAANQAKTQITSVPRFPVQRDGLKTPSGWKKARLQRFLSLDDVVMLVVRGALGASVVGASEGVGVGVAIAERPMTEVMIARARHIARKRILVGPSMLLGIETATDTEDDEYTSLAIENGASVDAVGRVICQSSLRVNVIGEAPLELSLQLTPDSLEPIFSGAAWAGTVLWRAAVRLIDAALLGPTRLVVSDASVVELGAGLGVPGMVCARLGARVVLTEQDSLVELLERNAQANFDSGIRCAELDWEADKARRLKNDLNDGEFFDIVICCDCVYVPLYGDSFYKLVEAIDMLAGPDTQVLLSVERRFVKGGEDGVDTFLATLVAAGFDIVQHWPSEPPVDILLLRRRHGS